MNGLKRLSILLRKNNIKILAEEFVGMIMMNLKYKEAKSEDLMKCDGLISDLFWNRHNDVFSVFLTGDDCARIINFFFKRMGLEEWEM